MIHQSNYKRISDYGVIGNLHTVALVGRDGSIDWLCLPELDSPSVLGAILDARRGGRFLVAPAGAEFGRQRYLEETNVLETCFEHGDARLHVIDFMPLSGDIEGRKGDQPQAEVHRILSCSGGGVEVEVDWSPRMDYARAEMRIERQGRGWIATGGGDRVTLAGVEGGEVRSGDFGLTFHAQFTLRPGEQRALVMRWDSDRTDAAREESRQALERTAATWRDWGDHERREQVRRWAGDYEAILERSGLVLRLLTHGETGAMAAAATMGLPMRVGCECNFDYRYAWIRDTAQHAQALIALGHQREAIEAMEWMENIACQAGDWELQIMYSLRGKTDLDSHRLDHLEGYRCSRPVCYGNAAATQFQLEVYGELMNTAYELVRRDIAMEEFNIEFLSRVADHVAEVWERPDAGIWELHTDKQMTYSKVMAWVALDRAVQLARRTGMRGDQDLWMETAEKVRKCVMEHGYNERLGAFVMTFDSNDMDAANLRIPLMEFLPGDDERVVGTIDRSIERLLDNGVVWRFEEDCKRAAKEAGFGRCTFWLIDALCLAGRVQEASELLASTAARANHLLLMSEQWDPLTGEMLGNFPQAFSHIGLVNSALYLAWAEGRDIPEHAPIGTPEHRESLTRD